MGFGDWSIFPTKMRNFKKLKTLGDYSILDAPKAIHIGNVKLPSFEQSILRMLVRPKYGNWFIPSKLNWLKRNIYNAARFDERMTEIKHSFCYVTVRHGKLFSETDDEWHFDGSSFRTDLIPERNYIWVSDFPTEYKMGRLEFPKDFDPIKHNLFKFADAITNGSKIRATKSKRWYLLTPFCLHRRPKINGDIFRTFIRICFTDIEGRDINNTLNPLLETDAYGRDPVRTFRDRLLDYHA